MTSAAHPVPYVRAHGDRRTTGRAHGETVPELVRATLAWSLEQLGAAGVTRADARERAATLFAIVEARTPDLADEVRGIAEGARLDTLDVAIINTRYELLFIAGRDADRPRGRASVPGAECTLFGATGDRTRDGHPIIAQNVDLGPDSRDLWIMLDAHPNGAPRVLTATLAGMLAQEGLNDAGLALCGSMIRSGGWRTGYPTRKFLRRRVLEQTSVQAGIDAIRATTGRASSHNLLLADASGRVADIETTIDDVHVLEPERGVIAHSNHYLSRGTEHHNALLDWYLENTTTRCTRARELLETHDEPITVEAVQAMLRDHTNEPRAVCRHHGRDESGAETNVAVVAEPAARRLHVAFGPPCETPFTTYTLEPAAPTA